MVPAGGARDDIAMVALHNPPIPEELDLRLSAEPETLAPMRRSLRRWLDSVGATTDEVAAITLATSEAAANAIEHAYALAAAGYDVRAHREGHDVVVVVRDRGHWRPPRGENRGRGQTIIRASMDDVDVDQGEAGTVVTMRRRLGGSR
jgi:anti-sigma regulatory factor (Ser/Thr protein kinase)